MPREVITGYELSPPQRRLWHLREADAGAALRGGALISIEGPLDPARLERTVQKLSDHHEVLRTVLRRLPGMVLPLQVVQDPEPVPMERHDLRGLSAEDQWEVARRLLRAAAESLDDPEHGPCWHVALALLGSGHHLLLFACHVLIADRTTLANLFRELVAGYRADGADSEEEPLQYPDLAQWQNELLETEGRNALVSYWRRHQPPEAEAVLPFERRPTGRMPLLAQHLEIPWEVALVARVYGLAGQLGASATAVLLAAWWALLERLSGGVPPAAGVVLDGRAQEDLGGTLGPLSRALPLVLESTPGLRFDELVLRTEKALDGHREWQDLYTGSEAEDGGEGADGYLPYLFEHVLLPSPERVGDLTFALVEARSSVDRFKLHLAPVERGDALVLELGYDSGAFTRLAVRELAARYRALLESALEDPRGELADLDPLGGVARHRLLRELNDTAAEFSGEPLLHRRFERRAVASPDRVAVAAPGRQLTYGELDALTGRLARELRRLGAGPERRVAICLEPSAELVVALLAVLRAGAAYLPLDPAYPRERQAFMLGDSGAPILVTQRRQLAALPEFGGTVVLLDAGWHRRPEPSADPAPPAVTGENPAYVIFTSGSTGKPKGVVVSHRAICNRLLWMQSVFRFSADDRFVLKTPVSFDASIWELFLPLWIGARLEVARPGGHQDVAYLARLVSERQATILQVVPSLLELLLGEPAFGECRCLRRVFSGGERLTPEAWRRFRALLPAELVNLYGPTESSIDAAFWRCQGRPEDGVPIGRPISNVEIHVTGRGLGPCPSGVAGEVVLGGAGLARGYANRPGLTAERFVPDPFSGRCGARLYRTGDLSRRWPSGEVEVLGRLDHQVKVHGLRIELGEIEAALAAHPAVAQAVAVVREDLPGDRRLVAYLVPAGAPPAVTELRTHLLAVLPNYMVPTAFVQLEALPRLPNGKVDRHGLPAPERVRPDLGKKYVAPRNPREEKLAAIWTEVLGLDRIGVEDNFFELGGDSILGIQIVSRAREAGFRFSPQEIFRHQTLAALAAAADVAEVRAEQSVVLGPVPPTPIQHDFFERRLAEEHHYNQAVLLALKRSPAPGDVAQLVARLLAHHDALRLRFERGAGTWSQELPAPGAAVPYALVDLAALGPGAAAAALESSAADVQRSLDLSRGPLLRAVQFRGLEGGRDRILMVVHHLAIDGVSWRILLEDLERGLRALLDGEEPRLPAKTTSFKEWAERLAASATEFENELDQWLGVGREPARPLPLELSGGAESNTEESAEMITVSLDEEATRDLLLRLPESYPAVVEELLLAALVRSFTRWTGEDRLVVDLESHGREPVFDGVDLSRTVGWFTAVYPVVLELGEAGDPGATLKGVKERLRRLPHRGLGYGVLRFLSSEASVRERLAALPAAEVSFNYLGRLDRVLSGESIFAPAEESAGRGQSPRQRRRYVLDVNALVGEGRLTVNWSYSRALHTRATIERLARDFLAELRTLVAHCLRPGTRGWTPVDFPLAERLDQATLDRLAEAPLPIEDIYPLTPLQQGLLFGSVRRPGSGAYFQQIRCEMTAELSLEPFAEAWQLLVDRHAALRTEFVWKEAAEPLQVVRRGVRLPWELMDWSDLDPREQSARLERLLAEDRARGFDFARAPLMRVTLVRLGRGRYELLWSSHHLVLDGWSGPILVRELAASYQALCEDRRPELPDPRPYRSYIEWLGEQNLALAEAYWRRTLAGFGAPTPIGALPVPGAGSAPQHREHILEISEQVTAELKGLAQQHRVALNALVQGLWALLLAHFSGAEDLVYGLVLSGRPASLEGSEEMVGMFVNTLPARVRIERESELVPWLEELQAEQAEGRRYEYSPLARVLQWSELPPGVPLFESTFAFNNYPTEAPGAEGAPIAVGQIRWNERTTYPLDFTVGVGRYLALRLMYDSSRLSPEQVEELAVGFRELVRAVIDDPSQELGSLLGLLKSHRRRRDSSKGETPVTTKAPMFKKIKPKVATVPNSQVVIADLLHPESRLPLLMRPAHDDVDLVSWAKSERQRIDARLAEHGAILFRGFGIDSAEIFESFAAGVCDDLFKENTEHPRDSVSGNVYTPVFYPPEKKLLWHNENSFNHCWPRKILFCAAQPAREGGETPIVDSRAVYERIDPAVRRPFEEKGVLYMRNYGEGVGLTWQTVFDTEDRSEVERRCRESRMEWQWKDDRLKTLARRPAVIRHPVTGEKSWFNQAQHWHVSCLDEETRQSAEALFAEDDLPRNCYYGDGTPIPDSAMEHVLDVYRELERSFAWQKGDVILVDNVLTAHGRNAFVGPRKLLVALGEMWSFSEDA